jgi:hypothetical protein
MVDNQSRIRHLLIKKPNDLYFINLVMSTFSKYICHISCDTGEKPFDV